MPLLIGSRVEVSGQLPRARAVHYVPYMTLETGSRLGPYEVVSLLGKGGMGEVYKAHDPRLGRNVAIKVLPDSLSGDPRFRQRLRREAKTISQLQHPHICTLHDIGEQDGVRYLVMEYLEGETLEERLRAGPLAVDEARRIGKEIAEALGAAHNRGVVHRDLKPGNVILTKAGTKVLDFGLAKSFEGPIPDDELTSLRTLPDALTREDAIVGTFPYMAPEQLQGKQVDARTDIWALGCVLYEMVTGERPFVEASKASLIAAILRSEPEAISTRQPLAPYRLDLVVGRCLEKDPENRWQSARDVAFEVASVETGVEMAATSAAAAAASTQDASTPAASSPATPVPGVADRRGIGRAALWVAAAVVLAVAVGYWAFEPAATEPVIEPGEAVAVLPFENMTGNDQLDYLGLGLAAGLISQLAELPGVNVVGRSRAWSAQQAAGSPLALAERLGASVFVEGEVHLEGQKLRVDVATSEPDSAIVLWSESFDGSQDQLYELQQRIADSVARVLSVSLSREDRRRLARGGPSSQAFDFYLQGLERLEQPENPRHLEFAGNLFRQAIRIDSDVAIFHAALATTLARQRLEANRAIDPEEIERQARRALELDPELPEAQVALARALRGRGRFAESIAALRPLLARHPKPDEAFRELAHSYEQAGDIAASMECLETAVALAPGNWFNWNALGALQAVEGDLQGAKSSLEKALELAPDSVTWPRLNLGGVKMLLARSRAEYEDAVAEFEATGATTSDPKLTSNLATAYFYLGRLDQAEPLYRRAVELDPNDHRYRRNLGDVLWSLDRREEARVEFRAALGLAETVLAASPDSNDALRSRALYAAKTGDCEAGVGFAREARPLLPSNWQNHLDLAMAFALCGQRAEALEAVEVCLASGLPGGVLRQQAELEALADDAEFLQITE